MTPHENVRPLLALSAAGALEPAEERLVREHVRECAGCAAHLAELGELGGAIGALPVPQPPPAVVERTQALMAAELAGHAERRRSTLLAAGLGLFGWAMSLATWAVWRLLTGGAAAALRVDFEGVSAWVVWSTLTLLMAAPAAAALAAARRKKEETYPC